MAACAGKAGTTEEGTVQHAVSATASGCSDTGSQAVQDIPTGGTATTHTESGASGNRKQRAGFMRTGLMTNAWTKRSASAVSAGSGGSAADVTSARQRGVRPFVQAALQRRMSKFSGEDVTASGARKQPRRISRTLSASGLNDKGAASTSAPSMVLGGGDGDDDEVGAATQAAVEAERARLSTQVASRAYRNDRRAEGQEARLRQLPPRSPAGSLSATPASALRSPRVPPALPHAHSEDSVTLRSDCVGFVTPMKWALTIAIGVLVALEAGFIILGSHSLVHWRLHVAEHLHHLNDEGYLLAFGFLLLYGAIAGLLTGSLVTCVAPHAGGGGIPEVIAYLNGVEMPAAFNVRTWFVRSLGLLAVTSAGLFAGPEGPFVHLGSLVALGALVGPSFRGKPLWPSVLSGQRNRCEFVAQGAAMGVAAAFGSPVGGVLFSLEEASTFWSQAQTWRSLAGCIVATLGARLAKSGFTQLSASGFIEFPDIDTGFEPWELGAFAVLAVATGLAGALFCRSVGAIAVARRRAFSLGSPTAKSRRLRVLEVLVVVFITVCASYLLPLSLGCNDLPHPSAVPDHHGRLLGFDGHAHHFYDGLPDIGGLICPEGQYSDVAFVLLQPKETAVRALFSRELAAGAVFRIPALLGCFALVFVLTLMTFGSAVPCGLFIPNILAGACLGRAYGQALQHLGLEVHPGVYALMGSAGMLSGFSRMTVALVMIMVEITVSMRLAVPLILVIMVTKLVADRFGPGVNHVLLGLNPSVHLLEDELSEDHALVIEGLTVHDVCTTEVTVLRPHETVDRVVRLISSTPYSGYPVVSEDGMLLTLVTRVQLASLLASLPPQETASINMERLAHGVPQMSSWCTPLAEAYHHFRSCGLQHLCVVGDRQELLGIVTRTDLARLCHHGQEGVEAVRSLIHRKQAAIDAGVVESSCRNMEHVDSQKSSLSASGATEVTPASKHADDVSIVLV